MVANAESTLERDGATTNVNVRTAAISREKGSRGFTVPLWQGCRVIRKHFLTYLALTTVAISQPIFDLYGKNSTVFSTAKLSPFEVVLFLLIVGFVPALLATGLDRISRVFGPKVNESMRLLIIAGFSFVIGLAVARWANLEGDIPAVALGTVLALLVPIIYDKQKWVREWSRWLAVLAVVVLANTAIQLQPVILQVQGAKSDAEIGAKDISVLQIVLDEFPLAPLLDRDGNINKERFPGFAELASVSTWYRNNLAASNFTHQAVPAVLASQVPAETSSPFISQYPKSIFTLFGEKTKVSGVEPVTSLCPLKVCPQADQSTFSFNASHMSDFLRDASYVYGQRVFPPSVRSRIPSVDGAWGGFGAVADKFKEQYKNGALSQPDAVLRAVKEFGSTQDVEVSVVHALIPHAPWRLTPDSRIAPLSSSISTSNPDTEDGVSDTYQTFLYQVGAADTMIREALQSLRASGKWDKTLLVVTADHGISFVPSMPQRHTDFSDLDQSADVYRIPTFIKYPGQSSGAVDDCASTNLDLLPTIVDVTKTKTEWKFAGQSLANGCPARTTREVVSATGEIADIETGFEHARARSDHYSAIVPRDGGIERVAAIGRSASLIGKSLTSASVDTRVTGWVTDQRTLFNGVSRVRGADIPSLLTGTINVVGQLDEGTEGVVAVDGVAAGVIGELSNAQGDVSFTAILDYTRFTKGDHVVELFIRSPQGAITKVGNPR